MQQLGLTTRLLQRNKKTLRSIWWHVSRKGLALHPAIADGQKRNPHDTRRVSTVKCVEIWIEIWIFEYEYLGCFIFTPWKTSNLFRVHPENGWMDVLFRACLTYSLLLGSARLFVRCVFLGCFTRKHHKTSPLRQIRCLNTTSASKRPRHSLILGSCWLCLDNTLEASVINLFLRMWRFKVFDVGRNKQLAGFSN